MATGSVCLVEIVGTSSLLYGRPYEEKKLEGEQPEDYENRTWMNRTHVHSSGKLCLPGLNWKRGIDGAAKHLGQKIPGKGNKTWTRVFLPGIQCYDPTLFDATMDDIEPWPAFVPASGVPGDGKRVWRKFPLLKEWATTVEYHIIDPSITQKVMEPHLEKLGMLGMGTWRGGRGGFFGRFEIKKIIWQE
jgi:hypothetical protein